MGLLAATRLRQPSATNWIQIGDCNHLHVRMILKTELRTKMTKTITRNANSNLAIGKWLPFTRTVRSILTFLKTSDDIAIGVLRHLSTDGPSTQSKNSSHSAYPLQESPAG